MIISGLTLVGVIAASFLPETLHQKLANTLQEAQKFGKHQKFWSMPHKKPAPKDCKEMEKLNPDNVLTATA